MTYVVEIKDEARLDALEAFLYYEEKKDGLGEEFLEVLTKQYEDLSRNPQYYSFVYSDREKTLRDVKPDRFPYVVMFDIDGSKVIVYSVHNTYRNRE